MDIRERLDPNGVRSGTARGHDGLEAQIEGGGRMDRIWKVVLEPLLRAIEPRAVVGLADAHHAIHPRLADFAHAVGCRLQVTRDLAAVEDAESVDVVFVPRSASWHATSTALGAIDAWHHRRGRFPLVVLPGGRRTRLEPSTDGVRPVVTATAAAAQAFVDGSGGELAFTSIPALEGVGLVHPAALLRETPAFAEVLEALSFLEEGEREVSRVVRADRRAREQRDARIRALRRERDDLLVWFEQLAGTTRKILNSRRFRVGHAVAEFKRRLLLERRTFRGHLESRVTIDQFRAWKSGKRPVPPSVRSAVLGERVEETAAPELPSETFDATSVDVIVCIDGSLEDARACLTSVVESHVPSAHRLYVVHDQAGPAVSRYLRDFATRHRHVTVIETRRPEGFARAANRGLRESRANYAVVIRGDVIVPTRWLIRLVECGESDPWIGIVGPLANDAGAQSVPGRDRPGNPSRDELPVPTDLEASAELVSTLSPRRFPRVPRVAPRCFALRRKLIHAVGYLDEQAFPRGPGALEDYAMRAHDAGFHVSVADDAYVWCRRRAASVEEERLERAAERALRRRYGAERLARQVRDLGESRGLRTMRRRVRRAMEALDFFAPALPVPRERLGRGDVLPSPPASARGALRVRLLVSDLEAAGRACTAARITRELARLGVEASFAALVPPEPCDEVRALGVEPLFLGNGSDAASIPSCDVLVATDAASAELAAAAATTGRCDDAVLLARDDERLDRCARDRRADPAQAYASLANHVVPNEWMRARLRELGLEPVKVLPGIDLERFYPRRSEPDDAAGEAGEPATVVALARFDSPRYGLPTLVDALRQLHRARPAVRILLVGDDLSSFRLPFRYRGAGLVRDAETLAGIFSSAGVFVDPSSVHATGLTGLEAMACGAACVTTDRGGVLEYARDGENAILVPPQDPQALRAAIERVLDDEELAARLRAGGVRTASSYGLRREAEALQRYLRSLRHEPAALA